VMARGRKRVGGLETGLDGRISGGGLGWRKATDNGRHDFEWK